MASTTEGEAVATPAPGITTAVPTDTATETTTVTAPPPPSIIEDNDMDFGKLPVFHGYVPDESPMAFMEDFELFCAVKGMEDARKHTVFGACMKGPAKAAYIRAGPGDYSADKTWIDAIYHTAQVKQALQDQLNSMTQGLGESPLLFHLRITYNVDVARVADGQKATTIDSVFMNGLHPEITRHIRMQVLLPGINDRPTYA